MNKSVVFFLSDFQSGGTEWFALRLARGLLRHNITPVILVVRPYGDLLPLFEKECEIVSLSGTGYTFFGVLKTLPAIVRFLRLRKPDVFFGGLTILNIVAALAVKIARTKTKLIIIEHMRLSLPAFSLWAKIKRTIKIIFVRLSYVGADNIVAVSNAARDDLVRMAKIDPAHTFIIPNPIIPDDFDDLVKEPLPAVWPSSKPVIVAIGRLLPNKDFETLLRAFKEVIKTKDARLLIFGEGEDFLRLEKRIADLGLSNCATLAGQIDNVFSVLSAADLFVLPSRSEAFGNVIVEALACGTPVISTDCGGPREILEDGKWGELVPVGNFSLMAEAICKTLDAPPCDKKPLVTRGRSFDVESSTQAYLKLMNQK